MRFTAVLELGGTTATGIHVPDGVVEALDAGKRPAVTADLGGYTYRTTVGTRGGRFMIPVSAEVRAAAGLAAGDRVEVELTLDTEPRVMAVPDDLAAVLAAAPDAAALFGALAYSHQRAYVLWVDSAKTSETRERRLGQAVEKLLSGKKQP